MLMDTVKKKLGYMVRSERERRGLSQAKLAEQAGVSTRTISDIETCNGNPELATLIPIAQFLDISIDAAVQDDAWNKNDVEPEEMWFGVFFYQNKNILHRCRSPPLKFGNLLISNFGGRK